MFTKADFKMGMKVYFGRRNGEKTLGQIVKMSHPTKAKVKTLEARGVTRERDAGVIWTVPYSLMTPADPTAKPGEVRMTRMTPTPPAVEPLKYSPFAGSDNLILEAILDCYNGLSPENLACDGEASIAHIRRTSTELNRKLKGLFIALGRTVDEGEVYDWYRQKSDYELARKEKNAKTKTGEFFEVGGANDVAYGT